MNYARVNQRTNDQDGPRGRYYQVKRSFDPNYHTQNNNRNHHANNDNNQERNYLRRRLSQGNDRHVNNFYFRRNDWDSIFSNNPQNNSNNNDNCNNMVNNDGNLTGRQH